MLEVPVYNTQGEQIRTMAVDESVFGSEVNVHLLKQAVVAYHASRRQGSAKTKSRAEVEGSTRKLYKQKGTGNARRGNIRTNVMRGGGMAFAKRPRDFRQTFPRNMRRAALRTAILAKIQSQDLMVIEGLTCPEVKTRQMADLMKNLKVNRSCLLTLAQRDRNVYLSSRNLQDLTVRIAEELNAFDVATRRKMMVTAEAMSALIDRETK